MSVYQSEKIHYIRYLPTEVCKGTRPYGQGASVFDAGVLVVVGVVVTVSWHSLPVSVTTTSDPGGQSD